MSDFNTVLVKDDRLDCKSSLSYEVYKSGMNVTQAVISATSANSSQHLFNVIVPSQNVVIDRNIRYEADINFEFTLTAAAAVPAIDVPKWGKNIGTCAFPLNSLVTTMSAIINNNTVMMQSRELMPFLVKLFSREELNSYQETTPCMPDNVRKFADSSNFSCNVLAGLENMSLDDLMPRGAFKLNYFNNNATSGFNTDNTLKWQVVPQVAGVPSTFRGSITVSEPLFLSPFLFNEFAKHRQGIYGINNLSLTMNIGDTSKFIKSSVCNFASANPPAPTPAVYNNVISNVTLSYDKVNLRLTYITPHPSEQLPARNIVPYYTLQRWSYPLGAVGAGVASTQNNTLITSTSSVGNSNVVNLNQIPDKFFIGVKPSADWFSRKGIAYGDFFLPIKSISVSFNNSAGLLSSASQKQLWQMSVVNGLKQKWQEYYGSANFASNAPIGATAIDGVTLMGGFLVIAPASDIQISEEYLAPGSIGNYQFQINNVTFENHGSEAFEANDLELNVVAMMSGMMVFERGTSAVYTALLSKEMVLEASSKQGYFSSKVHRQIGGNIWDDIKTGLSEVSSAVAPVISAAAPLLPAMVGMGESGGRKKLARHSRA